MNLNGMPHAEMPNNKVQSDSFYPQLSIQELSENYAIATEYGNNVDMVTTKLTEAAFFVNNELSEYNVINWSTFNKLEEISNEKIDGIDRLTTLYKKAVYSLAKSNLLISKLGETHRDQQATQSEVAIDSKKYWKNQAFSAIRQIMSVSENISVELI
ncbi:head completion/stabilization protein [Thalassotalea sp. 1_MG-2023]|uniref:head completion/stabilization protein n=1 Tax=Thalassotalea sp. 1_MG-2023 TaxID=3062680 RepID=UPI0026E31555|nr:head completion/stabilization protein [Thalassotalea sp. 1_MG-2023]MDO6426231.1 head completion/stabilization protein [Thalassotalea sp. 1_MG-2023]